LASRQLHKTPQKSRTNVLARGSISTNPETLLLFLRLLGAFCGLFAFDFLFALLDDFGLGWRGRFRRHRIHGLLFFDAQSNYVCENAFWFRDQLHLAGVDWNITRAKLTVHREMADIHLEFRGNFAGQAFDFHFTGDDFKNATFDLYARR